MPLLLMSISTVLLLATGLWTPARAHWLKRTGRQAEAEVTGRRVVDRGEDHHTELTLTFTDHDGHPREFETRLLTTRSAPLVGTRVPVGYPADRPEEARMLTHTWRATRSYLAFLLLVVMWMTALVPHFQ
ncbi:DUF3592 domain-containing protein [Streptomyces sp. NPDC021212]|uniref:DUF3592 domain-containing protein n=1 Tax=Streptomyces sp. NPDC021212 TaxID=3365118 RepID=UPI0037A4B3B9